MDLIPPWPVPAFTGHSFRRQWAGEAIYIPVQTPPTAMLHATTAFTSWYYAHGMQFYGNDIAESISKYQLRYKILAGQFPIYYSVYPVYQKLLKVEH